MNAGTGSSARKLIPGKLEEELKNMPRYKVGEPTKNMRQIMDDSAERAMYDELFGGLLHPKPAEARSKPNIAMMKNELLGNRSSEAKREDSGGSSSNSDIFLKRLEKVEAEARALRNQVAKLSVTNGDLQTENRALTNQLKVYSVNGDMLQESKQLRKENKQLKDELEEMHAFLADYGLVWVGHGEDKADDGASLVENEGTGDDNKQYAAEEMSKENIAASKAMFEKLKSKVRILNDQTKSAPAVVKTTGDASCGGLRKARLVHAGEDLETVKLTFYLNGLMINRGPFRHKSSASYGKYLQDIADGYFPLEYKEDHPDGVLFDLIDKHDANFKDGVAGVGLSGNDNYDREMKAGQLLQRLPKTTIRNGEIVHVREDVAKLFGNGSYNCNSNNNGSDGVAESKSGGGNSNALAGPKGTSKNPIILQTRAWRDSQNRDPTDGKECDGNSDDVPATGTMCTVQIRLAVSLSNNKEAVTTPVPPIQAVHTLQVKMYSTDTVAEVAEEVARYLNKEVGDESCGGLSLYVSEQVELRNSYPSRVLQHSETLEAAGFVPNGSMSAKLL